MFELFVFSAVALTGSLSIFCTIDPAKSPYNIYWNMKLMESAGDMASSYPKPGCVYEMANGCLPVVGTLVVSSLSTELSQNMHKYLEITRTELLPLAIVMLHTLLT